MDTPQPLTRGQRADLVTRVCLPRFAGSNSTTPVVMKSVLYTLDQFTGQRSRCWPSVELIAECANCISPDGRPATELVKRAIRQLVQLQLLHHEPRRHRSRRWTANRDYFINYDRIQVMVDDRRHVHLGVNAHVPPSGSQGGTPACTPTGVRGERGRSPGGNVGAAQQGTLAFTPKRVLLGNEEGEQASRLNEPDEKSMRPGDDRPDAARSPSWVAEFHPHLVGLGINPTRVAPLCTQAGSRQRVVDILRMMQFRAHQIRDAPAYFADLCSHPERTATDGERRRAAGRNDQ